MRHKTIGRVLFIWFVLFLVGFTVPVLAGKPLPPPQPVTGPGGKDYPHGEVKVSGPFFALGHSGEDNFKYFIFEPASPKPAVAPVVLFLHGLEALDPEIYGEWMRHIVRKGYTLVWVQYEDGKTIPLKFPINAGIAWVDALTRLSTGPHVRPERGPDGQIRSALVGHSMGGWLGMVLAANASVDPLLPSPEAIVAIEPGGRGLIPVKNLGGIDPDTKLLLLVADEDRLVCTKTATFIWEQTPQLSDDNRDYLLAVTDDRGFPPLIANHIFPTTQSLLPFGDTSALDARDFFITYKLSVAMLNCAFRGTDCGVALGNGSAEQVSMGVWSDGTPVEPMQFISDPTSLEAQCDRFPAVPPPTPSDLTFNEIAPLGFGDFNNSKAWSMVWWKGDLYVGTARAHMCVEYVALAQNFGRPFQYPPLDPEIRCTESPQDLPLQAEIWRYQPIEHRWDRVFQSPNDVEIPDHPGKLTAPDAGFRNLIVFTERKNDDGGDNDDDKEEGKGEGKASEKGKKDDHEEDGEDDDFIEVLYAGGTTSEVINPGMPPPRILRSSDGENWEPIPQDPGTVLGDLKRGQANWRAMAVYKDRLYAVIGDLRGGGPLLEAANPVGGNDNFRFASPEGMQVYEMAVFNGYLYVGLVTPDHDTRAGYAVAKTDATGEPPYHFETVVERGGFLTPIPSNSVVSMFVYKGDLYVGTDKPAEMIRIHADDTWDLLVGDGRDTPDGFKEPLSGMKAGFDDLLNEHIWRMEKHHGKMWVGTNDVRGFLKPYEFFRGMLENMGFDLASTEDGENYAIHTRTALDKFLDIGIRVFDSTPVGLFFGTSNPFEGLRIYQSEEPVPLVLDIKPESPTNAVQMNEKGVISVAILTTNAEKGDELLNFDAPKAVKVSTVQFGPDEATEIHGKGHPEDVDGDGDADLVFHFDIQKTGIKCGDSSAALTGKTAAGDEITGSDVILTMGCDKKKK